MRRKPAAVASRTLGRARWVHRRVFDPLLDLLWPSTCAGCRQRLGPLQRLGICLGCWSDLHPLPQPLCGLCALPRSSVTDLLGPGRQRCASCVGREGPIRAMHAVVAYDAIARSILLRAKSACRRELLVPLARQLARSLAVSGFARDCTVVTAVPAHPWSLLRRGFSPAADLARPVARLLGLRFTAGGLRRRLGGSSSIKRLRAHARRRVLDGAFRAGRGPLGERVLLVDDVVTTGATASACARALLAAGAVEIRVAAWARTLPPGSADTSTSPRFDRP